MTKIINVIRLKSYFKYFFRSFYKVMVERDFIDGNIFKFMIQGSHVEALILD